MKKLKQLFHFVWVFRLGAQEQHTRNLSDRLTSKRNVTTKENWFVTYLKQIHLWSTALVLVDCLLCSA